MEPGRAIAIVVAAGSGSRLGVEEPKAFLTIGGRPIVEVAVERTLGSPAIRAVVVTAPSGAEERMRAVLAAVAPEAVVVAGGATRQASVRAGLAATPDGAEVIVVHDAARPFAPPELFTEVVERVVSGADAAVPVLPIPDTIKRVRDGAVISTEPRDDLVLAQTPQAFRAQLLRVYHERARTEGREVTDDAALFESAGARVVTVAGDPRNFKITTALDLAHADELRGGRRG
jgi:2-C-methyl-D-erythritol 4-phosphate cytidylyltransferase